MRRALERLERTTAPGLMAGSHNLPLIQIATIHQPDITDLLKKMQQQQQLGVEVAVIETEDETICQKAAATGDASDAGLGEPENKGYSISICPSKPTSTTETKPSSQVLVRNGITYIYPNNSQEVESLLKQVLVTTPKSNSNGLLKEKRKRKPLKISLIMEQQRNDWDAWAHALSSWIRREQASLQAWPCLRGAIETELVLSTLLEQPNRKHKSNNMTITATPTEQPPSMRLIHMADMKESVLDRHLAAASDKDDYWNVILYIPRQGPVRFVGEVSNQQPSSSQAMYAGPTTLVTTIDQAEYTMIETNTTTEQTTEDEDDGTATTVVNDQTIKVPMPLESLVNNAMLPLSGFLRQQCLGVVPSDDEDSSMLIDTDHTVPLWQLDVWLQRTLKETYDQARTELREEVEWLLQCSTWVVIDDDVAAHWEPLVDLVHDAYQFISSVKVLHGEFDSIEVCLKALSSLEAALDNIETLRTDPSLMEPLRFSAPQFLAIFAPLCLPLFLPHFIGLLREWKRYKKLRSKQS